MAAVSPAGPAPTMMQSSKLVSRVAGAARLTPRTVPTLGLPVGPAGQASGRSTVHAQVVTRTSLAAARPGAGVASATTTSHSVAVSTVAASPLRLARALGESVGPVSAGMP